MTDAKIILLIGRSGRGKSTLANVITNTKEFKESKLSASETKKIQLGEFAENNLDYRIIDTPGIGDTKMSEKDVLNIIAEAIYLAKDGIGQVFFVTNGRFDQYEMATYDLLRTILFDQEITKHTTIVRTRFPDFRDDEECQKDITSMTEETQSQELTTANLNLAEIIKSCQKRIVHVNNPSLEIKNTKKLKLNEVDREESRIILLEHLKENCQGKPYNPPNLKKLSSEIADDYSEYLKKKEELRRELEGLKTEKSQLVDNQSPTDKNSKNKPKNNLAKENTQTELVIKEEPQTEENNEDNLEIVDINETIAKFQDKKKRLRKEIAEKEKIIHQKVLKHIFNNYEGISKELGGNIFLNSVAGEHPWPEIHSEFANKEIVIKWLKEGFNFQQTKDWATVLNGFNPKCDAEFCAWLRDVKELTVDKVKRLSHPYRVEQLRKEYLQQLKKETEILGKHSKQLSKEEDWAAIHEDFILELQQEWKGCGLTYPEAQEWIAIGFKPVDYRKIKEWKNHNFTPQQTKVWRDIGLGSDKYELIAYLREKGYQPSLDLNLEQLKEEFASQSKKNGNAQEWLNEKYPVNGTCQRHNDPENKGKNREDITYLDIRKGKIGGFLNKNKNLTGVLKLEGFTNLQTLIVSSHQLIELDVSDCPNLEELDCHGNELTSLNVNGCVNLKKIGCSNNNLKELDLSTCSKLEEVNINNNPNLLADKIKSNLVYNPEKGKLVKDDLRVKSGPQIFRANENSIRNILLIGITGNGKSALANTLSDTTAINEFKEGDSSVSVTKNFKKSDIVEWNEKKYRIIDNIGFGDTAKITKEDILYKIGEGIHSAKEGINQVLFVFKGRFAPEQVAAFKLFKDFISESKITEFTTLVRTNFVNFRKPEKCQEEKDDLLEQSQELKEIINSCNGVIYVDNPAIPAEGEEDERRINLKINKRKDSRKVVLDHLANNCQEIYKLKEWNSIYNQVGKCVEQIVEREQELAKTSNDSIRNKLQNEINESKGKIAEEVNAALEIEISPLPKLTARIEMKNPNIWPFNKK